MLWKKNYNCPRFFTKYFQYSVRVNTNDINLMYITMALRCQNSVKNGFAFLQVLLLSFKYFCFPSIFIQIFVAFLQIFFIAFLQIFLLSFKYFCFSSNIFTLLQILLLSFKGFFLLSFFLKKIGMTKFYQLENQSI